VRLPGIAWLRWVRARLAARPDTEHEQALVRLLVGVVLFFYLLPGAFTDPAIDSGNGRLYLVAMIGYLVFAAAVFAGILLRPGVSVARRLLSAATDVSAVSFFMAHLGVHAAPMFLIYVWITLANGFRFGQRYLLFALVLSVAGFGVVLAVDEFWSSNLTAGLGLAFAFVALSFYVRSLVAKLFDAIARAEAANQAKRRFISVVSHEMRTPLNAIIGMAELMRDTQLTREQADMLQTLRGSGQVMLGLVEDVLDFSKIEAGKLVLERTDFDLHALVNSTSRILQAQSRAKNVDFVVSIMPEVPRHSPATRTTCVRC
jgi:two-component system, sensor histidine kinase RpfC